MLEKKILKKKRKKEKKRVPYEYYVLVNKT